jgi:16S rRNA (cytosine1402-N4)-methyltransferase
MLHLVVVVIVGVILEKLNEKGRLFVFDQDIQAKDNLPNDPRITFIHSNYRYLQKFLRLNKALPVDGILADFGVSSYQIDTPESWIFYSF